MDTLLLNDCPATETLISEAYRANQPLVLRDGGGECLVAMTPAVFERILFDTAVLELAGRDGV